MTGGAETGIMLQGAVGDLYILRAASLLGHLALTPRREVWEEVARAGAHG